MNFEESEDHLISLGNEVLAMKLGLDNIGKLLAALGKPQEKYYKVQVAGTNGKGSTCAFLEAICLSAQISTGMFTSPHLVSITERVRINGREISEKDFARLATKVRDNAEKLVEHGKLETVPTFFEQVTAIALLAFAEAGVELVILETGLGGRLDATTAAVADVAVITPIDYDHQAILGDTIDEIAAEKAAIIHENSVVISARQRKDAAKVIDHRIEAVDAEIVPIDLGVEVLGTTEDGKYRVNFLGDRREYRNVTLNLRGFHQIDNALTALITAEFLTSEFMISTADVTDGLERASHKGRLEIRDNYIFDGAHNYAGANALRRFLDEFIEEPITLVFGSMRDKDLAEIAEVLFPVAGQIVLTRSDSPRAIGTKELRKLVPDNFAKENVFETKSVEEAIRIAAENSPEDAIICITGSLYLVGEAQKLLNNNN